jgi:hypothetical protein
MSSLWSSFFWSGLLDFPSKTMSCKLNHNLICLGPHPSSKVLGTNLKLLTNRNAWFHRTLLLAALCKVALTLVGSCSPRSAGHMSPIFVKESKVFFYNCYFTWKHLPAQKFCRSIEGPFYRSHCRPSAIWKKKPRVLYAGNACSHRPLLIIRPTPQGFRSLGYDSQIRRGLGEQAFPM